MEKEMEVVSGCFGALKPVVPSLNEVSKYAVSLAHVAYASGRPASRTSLDDPEIVDDSILG